MITIAQQNVIRELIDDAFIQLESISERLEGTVFKNQPKFRDMYYSEGTFADELAKKYNRLHQVFGNVSKLNFILPRYLTGDESGYVILHSEVERIINTELEKIKDLL